MVSRHARGLAFVLGLVSTATPVGCLLSEEVTASSDGRVVSGTDVSRVLESTLILDTGCVAAKVGPRHILTAARCVAANPAFEAGKTLRFGVASSASVLPSRRDAGADAEDGAIRRDAGTPDGGTRPGASPTDAGKPDGSADRSPDEGRQTAVIAEVDIHTSFEVKCKADACPFGSVAASDAKDIAVIIVDADLETIPTMPVDLDTVGQGDLLLALSSGCDDLEGTSTTLARSSTIAVPAKSVNHAGSPYVDRPELVPRLAGGYVVTPGSAWVSTSARLCKNDVGAPLLRSDRAAIAGVTSNFTTFGEPVPATVHHTRVDAASKVGAWLASLGVATTHSCEAEGGCPKREYDGGAPRPATGATADIRDAGADGTPPHKGDAGRTDADGGADESDDAADEEQGSGLPSRGKETKLPEEEDEDSPPEKNDEFDAGMRKKKRKDTSGCSAAPGSSSSTGLALGVALGLAASASRRRHRDRGVASVRRRD